MLSHTIMGLFAFVIALVSLCRIMADREFLRLTMMKRAFGRREGLAVHFIVTVAVPIVLGIVFLTVGVTGRGASGGNSTTLIQAPADVAPVEKTLPSDYLCFS